MNEAQHIKKIAIQLAKGAPIIALTLFLCVTAAITYLKYATPMFESTLKLKLDDGNIGYSSLSMSKEGDDLPLQQIISNEVEVIKSDMLIKKTLKALDFDVTYKRIGRIKETEMLSESPFKVDAKIYNETVYGQEIHISITEDSTVKISFKDETVDTRFNEFVVLEDLSLTVSLNQLSNAKLFDNFAISIASLEQCAQKIKNAIDVSPIEKDVAVIRISYQNEVPEKTTLFLNKHAETYINDFVENRSSAAKESVDFIDNQILEVGQKLKKAEIKLEEYKLRNKIINTSQETETDLRKIAQLKIQLANIEMRLAAIDNLSEYMNNKNKNFLDLAPHFEAFGDALYVEAMKQINTLNAQKSKLSLKYTRHNQKMEILEMEIQKNITYIKESVKNSKDNLIIQKNEIERTIKESEQKFDHLPSIERNMIVLKREFDLNQKIYNFLSEKRAEAAIAEATTISFHRILQWAAKPKNPVSPNKVLITFVAGLLGLVLGVGIVFGRKFISNKVITKEDLQTQTNLTIAGIVKKKAIIDNDDNCFESLISSLILENRIIKNSCLTITSSIQNEGKTFVSKGIATHLSAAKWNILLINASHDRYETNNNQAVGKMSFAGQPITKDKITGISHLQIENNDLFNMLSANPAELNKHITKLKSLFDLIIIDSQATILSNKAFTWINQSELTLYIAKSGITSKHTCINADLIQNKFPEAKLNYILNGAPRTTNYNGDFVGSRYVDPTLSNQKVISRIKNYIKFYINK